jgi:hypothetical protein
MANQTPLVLTNGTFLQSSDRQSYSHLDKAHALHQNAGKEHIHDLGVLEPYITSGYLAKPLLYDFTNQTINREYVDGHVFKHSHPIEDEPCYIMEDISGTDKPGIDNEKFKIKVNSNKYGSTYVLAADFHSPHQMLVTEDPVVEDGDGYILTVRRRGVGQADKHYPKELLRPGTKLFPVTTMHTEFAEKYADIPTPAGGVREYMNTVGYTRANLHYSVTREAAFSKMSANVQAGLADYRRVIEAYTFAKGTLGYSMSMTGSGKAKNMLTTAYKQKYGKKSESQLKQDIIKKAWIPEIELLGAAWIKNLVEQEAIWGVGGLIDLDGKTKAQSSIGYFQQLNMGNTHVYNIPGMTLQKLEFIIASRIKGKVTPFSGNVITLKCGQGALQLIKNQLNKLPSRSGMVMQANDYIEGIGKNNNQSLKWTNPNIDSWEMENGLGTIKFELAAGLDPIDANDFINPIVPLSNGTLGGHRLSSYMFIIDDITSGTDNVLELVYGNDWDMTHSVHQGKLAYPGNENGKGSWQRGSNHPGFEVYMEQRHKAYFVKDVTKSLLIKPINPFTNKPIYESNLK